MEKSNGTTGTIYWYMSPGIVGESDLTGSPKSEYVFDGERVARKDFSGSTTSVSYYFSDHLETASVVTDSSGTITEDEDYYPWGGELQFTNNDGNHYKFTGKERDAETGLDYFGARYYGNWLGRFVSADWSEAPKPVPYAELTDPQSLDLYGYVRSIPTARLDPDGHFMQPGAVKCWIACKRKEADDANARLLANIFINTALFAMTAYVHLRNILGPPSPPNANTHSSQSTPADPNQQGQEKKQPDEPEQQKQTSSNQMQEQVERGQAPKSVARVDKGIGPHEQNHVHFNDGSVLNSDGTWKHASHDLTNAERGWL
ncbi:MAG TPA: RHS repeat-associated core domain-containing protein [Candidatus Angelobacter sp.]|nr:RHS repeat-associated core domain-containing protein [Candidatus Angelobacter sp.]